MLCLRAFSWWLQKGNLGLRNKLMWRVNWWVEINELRGQLAVDVARVTRNAEIRTLAEPMTSSRVVWVWETPNPGRRIKLLWRIGWWVEINKLRGQVAVGAARVTRKADLRTLAESMTSNGVVWVWETPSDQIQNLTQYRTTYGKEFRRTDRNSNSRTQVLQSRPNQQEQWRWVWST